VSVFLLQRTPGFSPKHIHGKGLERRIHRHQRYAFQFRLGCEHTVEGIAMIHRVAAGADALEIVHGEMNEAVRRHQFLEAPQDLAANGEFSESIFNVKEPEVGASDILA
jgi:hypothetical protein